MASNIKGISLEIGGKTEPLQKALKDVNEKSISLQRELKEVNTLLKFDPKNTELLSQKHKILGGLIETTKEKLEALKKAESQAQNQFAQGKISEEQYRALQREIAATEGKLKGLETQAKKSNGVLTDKQAISNLQNIGKAAAIAGAAVGAAFVAVAVNAVKSADELQKQSDVTGISVERLQELAYVGNQLGVDLETITGAQAKLTKSMQAGRDGTGAQAEAFKALDVQVTNSDGSLRSSQEVMQESITALGQMTNDTERDALAMQLFGKSAMEMNPLIKAGGDEIASLTQKARDNNAVMSAEAVQGLDAFGDAVDGAKQGILSMVGEAFADLAPALTKLIDDLAKLPEWIKENETMLTIVGIAFGTLTIAIIAFNIAAAWTTITATAAATATAAWATAVAFLTSPITLTILAIGALIAIGVLLWKNWDKIGTKAKEIFDGIKNFVGGVIDGIAGGFKKMANGVIDALNWLIKGANKLKFDIPDWVPFIGGKTFGLSIPLIPKFEMGTKFLPDDMLIQAHKGEMIVPAKENPYANSGGRIMPNYDPKELAIMIRKELERANIVARVSQTEIEKVSSDYIYRNSY